MSSSYCNLLYHIVFATKGREPWMTAPIRPRIHQYIGGAIRAENGIAMIVNGTRVATYTADGNVGGRISLGAGPGTSLLLVRLKAQALP